jgi:hypothetical protein
MPQPQIPNAYLQQPFASTQHLAMQQMQDQIRLLEARLYQTQLQPPTQFYPPMQTMAPVQPQTMPQQQHGYTNSYQRHRSELGESQDNDAESDVDQGPSTRRRTKGRARTNVNFDDSHEQGSKKGKKSWFSGLK